MANRCAEVGDIDPTDRIVHRFLDHEQDLLHHLRQRLVHRALRQLSEINREIILLKDIQGLPLEEIAGMLELPLGTIKSRSSRARVELARAIVDLGGGPGSGSDGTLGAEAAI